MTSTGVTRSALTRPACFGVLGMRVPPPTVRAYAPRRHVALAGDGEAEAASC